MMGWYHDGMGWGGWLVMLLGMVAILPWLTQVTQLSQR